MADIEQDAVLVPVTYERVSLKRNACRTISQRGWLATRFRFPLVKKGQLVAPAIPSRFSLAGKQFEIRAIHEPLDTVPHDIRFAAVLASPLHHKATNILSPAPW